ncbi:MAG: hypothetical protein WC718_06235 [Phycisphaerales bacterium]
MNERKHASRISRELDDAKSPGKATPAAQKLVHRALADRDKLPWMMPPANMREKILDAVSESTATPIPLELPRLRPTPWGLLTAASVAAALGVGVLLGLRLAPLTHTGVEVAKSVPVPAMVQPGEFATVVASEEINEQPVVDPLAFVPARNAKSPIRMGLSAPLRGEVGRMSADAKRAIQVMLGPLPLADGE